MVTRRALWAWTLEERKQKSKGRKGSLPMNREKGGGSITNNIYKVWLSIAIQGGK